MTANKHTAEKAAVHPVLSGKTTITSFMVCMMNSNFYSLYKSNVPSIFKIKHFLKAINRSGQLGRHR